MKVMVGFLLNMFVVFTEATNRQDRRQKDKIGFVIRRQVCR